VSRLIAFVGATIGSSFGWWVGSWFGFATAALLSIVGMAAGLYAGRRVEQRYL
jgi:H+/Cl- antiporter ClcA